MSSIGVSDPDTESESGFVVFAGRQELGEAAGKESSALSEAAALGLSSGSMKRELGAAADDEPVAKRSRSNLG